MESTQINFHSFFPYKKWLFLTLILFLSTTIYSLQLWLETRLLSYSPHDILQFMQVTPQIDQWIILVLLFTIMTLLAAKLGLYTAKRKGIQLAHELNQACIKASLQEISTRTLFNEEEMPLIAASLNTLTHWELKQVNHWQEKIQICIDRTESTLANEEDLQSVLEWMKKEEWDVYDYKTPSEPTS